MLERYESKYEGLPCSINTFGFGYSSDSKLLDELATYGRGAYAFIPDSGFVGTVFVHTLSNLLVTACQNVEVNLEMLNGAELVEEKDETPSSLALPSVSHVRSSWGAVVSLGTLAYGQSRDFIARIKVPKDSVAEEPILQVTVK